MRPILLHDKAEIATFLHADRYRQLYSIGDLDDFYWPYTIWYGWRPAGQLEALILLYTAFDPPTLLVHAARPAPMRQLLAATLPLLPARTYAHLDVGMEEIATSRYQLHQPGRHYRMGLTNPAMLPTVNTDQIRRLTPADQPAIEQLYAIAYPNNWFDPRMLQTEQYVGIWIGSQLVAIAGVHVYAPDYGVAALGNITTHPAHRGQGLARATTAYLCRQLLSTVDTIGLNVRADNHAAIHLYRQLGFDIVAAYNECMMELRSSSG